MEEFEKEVIINDLNRVEEVKEQRDEQSLYEGFGLVTMVNLILTAIYMLLIWVFATMEDVPLLVKDIMLVFLSGCSIYLWKDLFNLPKEYIKLKLKV